MQANVAGLEEALAAEEEAAAVTDSPEEVTPTRDSSESEDTVQDSSDGDSEDNVTAEVNGAESNTPESTQQVIREFEADEAADEFDYLAFAQDRALFFWADILSLGIGKEEDFPEGMVEHIKKRMIWR